MKPIQLIKDIAMFVALSFFALIVTFFIDLFFLKGINTPEKAFPIFIGTFIASVVGRKYQILYGIVISVIYSLMFISTGLPDHWSHDAVINSFYYNVATGVATGIFCRLIQRKK